MSDIEDDINIDDDFNFDDDFDLDFGDPEPRPEPTNKREAVLYAATDVKDGIKESLSPAQLTQNLQEITGNLAPEALSDEMRKLSDIKRNLGYDLEEGLRERKDSIGTITNFIRNKTGNKLINSILDKVEDTAGINDGGRDNYEDLEQIARDEVGKQINETVDKYKETNLELTTFEQKESLNRLYLEAKKNNIFQEAISTKYFRKSLEYQYLLLLNNKKILEINRLGFNKLDNALSHVVKNTGLPDVLKARTTEALKAQARIRIGDSLFTKATESNMFSNLSSNLSNIKDNILDKIVTGADLADGLNTAKESADMMQELTGDSRTKMGAAQVGGALVNKLARSIGKSFENTETGAKIVQTIKDFTVNGSDTLSELSDDVRYGNMTDNMARRYLNDKSADTLSFLSDIIRKPGSADTQELDLGGNLTDSAVMDNQALITQKQVIPELLSKILREVQLIRTGANDNEIDEMTFDYDKRQFTSRKQVTNQLLSKINKLVDRSGVNSELADLSKNLGVLSKTEYSDNTKNEIQRMMLLKMIKGESLNLNKMKKEGFEGYSDEAKELLLKAMDNLDGMDELEKNDFKNKLNNSYDSANDRIPDFSRIISRNVENGDLQSLIDAKLIRWDRNIDKYVLDRKVYEDIMTERLKYSTEEGREYSEYDRESTLLDVVKKVKEKLRPSRIKSDIDNLRSELITDNRFVLTNSNIPAENTKFTVNRNSNDMGTRYTVDAIKGTKNVFNNTKDRVNKKIEDVVNNEKVQSTIDTTSTKISSLTKQATESMTKLVNNPKLVEKEHELARTILFKLHESNQISYNEYAKLLYNLEKSRKARLDIYSDIENNKKPDDKEALKNISVIKNIMRLAGEYNLIDSDTIEEKMNNLNLESINIGKIKESINTRLDLDKDASISDVVESVNTKVDNSKIVNDIRSSNVYKSAAEKIDETKDSEIAKAVSKKIDDVKKSETADTISKKVKEVVPNIKTDTIKKNIEGLVEDVKQMDINSPIKSDVDIKKTIEDKIENVKKSDIVKDTKKTIEDKVDVIKKSDIAKDISKKLEEVKTPNISIDNAKQTLENKIEDIKDSELYKKTNSKVTDIISDVKKADILNKAKEIKNNVKLDKIAMPKNETLNNKIEELNSLLGTKIKPILPNTDIDKSNILERIVGKLEDIDFNLDSIKDINLNRPKEILEELYDNDIIDSKEKLSSESDLSKRFENMNSKFNKKSDTIDTPVEDIKKNIDSNDVAMVQSEDRLRTLRDLANKGLNQLNISSFYNLDTTTASTILAIMNNHNEDIPVKKVRILNLLYTNNYISEGEYKNTLELDVKEDMNDPVDRLKKFFNIEDRLKELVEGLTGKEDDLDTPEEEKEKAKENTDSMAEKISRGVKNALTPKKKRFDGDGNNLRDNGWREILKRRKGKTKILSPKERYKDNKKRGIPAILSLLGALMPGFGVITSTLAGIYSVLGGIAGSGIKLAFSALTGLAKIIFGSMGKFMKPITKVIGPALGFIKNIGGKLLGGALNIGKKIMTSTAGKVVGSTVAGATVNAVTKAKDKVAQSKTMKKVNKIKDSIKNSKAGKLANSAVKSKVGKGAVKMGTVAGKTVFKTGGKIAGKMAGKLIPGVGLAIGLAEAADYASKGSYGKALLAGASGAASTIPIVGTALSFLGSGALAAWDYFSPDEEEEEAKEIPVKEAEQKKKDRDEQLKLQNERMAKKRKRVNETISMSEYGSMNNTIKIRNESQGSNNSSSRLPGMPIDKELFNGNFVNNLPKDKLTKVITRHIKKSESGSADGKYGIAKDIGDGAGISFGAYQLTRQSLYNFVKSVAIATRDKTAQYFSQGGYKQFARKARMNKAKLRKYLQSIGDTKLGRKLQDEVYFDNYLSPAYKLASNKGITEAPAVAHTVDHYLNAGPGGAKRMLNGAGGTDHESIANARFSFYRRLASRKPRLAKYLKGWYNRVKHISKMFNAENFKDEPGAVNDNVVDAKNDNIITKAKADSKKKKANTSNISVDQPEVENKATAKTEAKKEVKEEKLSKVEKLRKEAMNKVSAKKDTVASTPPVQNTAIRDVSRPKSNNKIEPIKAIVDNSRLESNTQDSNKHLSEISKNMQILVDANKTMIDHISKMQPVVNNHYGNDSKANNKTPNGKTRSVLDMSNGRSVRK